MHLSGPFLVPDSSQAIIDLDVTKLASPHT